MARSRERAKVQYVAGEHPKSRARSTWTTHLGLEAGACLLQLVRQQVAARRCKLTEDDPAAGIEGGGALRVNGGAVLPLGHDLLSMPWEGGAERANQSKVVVRHAARALLEDLPAHRGVQNRGFGSEVSDLRGDLDADEKTEVLIWRLVICGVMWAQMSAWRWGTRVWEVNDE